MVSISAAVLTTPCTEEYACEPSSATCKIAALSENGISSSMVNIVLM